MGGVSDSCGRVRRFFSCYGTACITKALMEAWGDSKRYWPNCERDQWKVGVRWREGSARWRGSLRCMTGLLRDLYPAEKGQVSAGSREGRRNTHGDKTRSSADKVGEGLVNVVRRPKRRSRVGVGIEDVRKGDPLRSRVSSAAKNERRFRAPGPP